MTIFKEKNISVEGTFKVTFHLMDYKIPTPVIFVINSIQLNPIICDVMSAKIPYNSMS